MTHPLEPLNSPKPPKVEPREGDSIISVGGSTFLYQPPEAPAPEPNPYMDKLPSTDEMAQLALDQTRTADVVQALIVEQVAIPDLWSQAVSEGDSAEMTRLRERGNQIPNELILANIAAAKARLEYAKARYAVAKSKRDSTATRAFDLGPEHDWPEGKQKALEATNEYESFQMATSDAAIALGNARRNLDAALAASAYGK